jgi:hypothetical protein
MIFVFRSGIVYTARDEDGLMLGYWRPAFLQLPDAMGWTSIKEHMLKSIPVARKRELKTYCASNSWKYVSGAITAFRSVDRL